MINNEFKHYTEDNESVRNDFMNINNIDVLKEMLNRQIEEFGKLARNYDWCEMPAKTCQQKS